MTDKEQMLEARAILAEQQWDHWRYTAERAAGDYVKLDAKVAQLRAERDRYREACAAMYDFWKNPDSEASVPAILNLVEAAMRAEVGMSHEDNA